MSDFSTKHNKEVKDRFVLGEGERARLALVEPLARILENALRDKGIAIPENLGKLKVDVDWEEEEIREIKDLIQENVDKGMSDVAGNEEVKMVMHERTRLAWLVMLSDGLESTLHFSQAVIPEEAKKLKVQIRAMDEAEAPKLEEGKFNIRIDKVYRDGLY